MTEIKNIQDALDRLSGYLDYCYEELESDEEKSEMCEVEAFIHDYVNKVEKFKESI